MVSNCAINFSSIVKGIPSIVTISCLLEKQSFLFKKLDYNILKNLKKEKEKRKYKREEKVDLTSLCLRPNSPCGDEMSISYLIDDPHSQSWMAKMEKDIWQPYSVEKMRDLCD